MGGGEERKNLCTFCPPILLCTWIAPNWRDSGRGEVQLGNAQGKGLHVPFTACNLWCTSINLSTALLNASRPDTALCMFKSAPYNASQSVSLDQVNCVGCGSHKIQWKLNGGGEYTSPFPQRVPNNGTEGQENATLLKILKMWQECGSDIWTQSSSVLSQHALKRMSYVVAFGARRGNADSVLKLQLAQLCTACEVAHHRKEVYLECRKKSHSFFSILIIFVPVD